MLKFVLLIALSTFAAAQIVFFYSAHNCTFEYDDLHNIVLVVCSLDCYIVNATDTTWDPIIGDSTRFRPIAEAIYAQIKAGTGVTSLTSQQAITTYGSRLEQSRCRDHAIHKVAYPASAK